MADIQKFTDFFTSGSFSYQTIGEHEHTLTTHCKLFMLALGREQSLYVVELNKANDKDQANTLNNLAMTQMRVALKQAAAFFAFNRYDQCIDNIVTAWQLPLSLKGTLLDSLPKMLADNSFTMLLFLSLFVRKGKGFHYQVTLKV